MRCVRRPIGGPDALVDAAHRWCVPSPAGAAVSVTREDEKGEVPHGKE